MTPITRGPTGIYSLYVPKQKGGVVQRSTGTNNYRVFKLMRDMIARLKNERRWPLLNAVVAKTITVATLFDADRSKGLDALEASLSAVALTPLVKDYLANCKGRGLDTRNIENIARQLESFLTVATTTADLTVALVSKWVSDLTTTPGTRRQYLYAVTGFTRFLVDTNVIKDYPLTKVKAPKPNAARMTYHDADTDEKIVQATRPDVRGLVAFVKATGIDVTPALDVMVREINLTEGTARLRGTKSKKRDVHNAIVESWAAPYIRADIADALPNAKPWAHLTRSKAYKQHHAACKAVGISGYTLKDSRHSVAVRMAKAGYSVFQIAEQLGNTDALAAGVYAVHTPKMTPRTTSHTTSEAKEKIGNA